ncbi:MAG TPA: hypothetical protein QF401_03635 [Candidatus Poseidoniaceae archaeon]|nr:hypothetical protein [Candidatus Poseidoniaceae archaeon]
MGVRNFALFVFFLFLVPTVVSAEPVTLIELSNAGALSDNDLGLKVGEVSPDGSTVLIAGSEGYARILSATEADDRSKDIELLTGRNATVHDVAWHPRGMTALMVGDEGLALRYDTYDHGVTRVNESFSVWGYDLKSLDWRPSGDFAYVGSDDGSIWKFAEHTGFQSLNSSSTSQITDITCHRNYNICFATSLEDGIAVIDQDHKLTWISGTSSETWIGVECADATRNDCVAFGSGLRSKTLIINNIDVSKSYGEQTMMLDLLSGEQTDVTAAHDGTSLIHLAPFSLVRHYPQSSEAFTVLLAEDATQWDSAIAGRALNIIWETGLNEGFILTEFGNIIAFTPLVEEVDSEIITFLVLGAVAISVPGVILGLIYMNSTWLQRKYKEWRFRKKGNK